MYSKVCVDTLDLGWGCINIPLPLGAPGCCVWAQSPGGARGVPGNLAPPGTPAMGGQQSWVVWSSRCPGRALPPLRCWDVGLAGEVQDKLVSFRYASLLRKRNKRRNVCMYMNIYPVVLVWPDVSKRFCVSWHKKIFCYVPNSLECLTLEILMSDSSLQISGAWSLWTFVHFE